MTTSELYNVILTSRYYISEHANILLDFEENGDPEYKNQLEKVLNLVLNTELLENHYTTILQSGSSSLLTDEELLTLLERNSELSFLPVKN